MSEEQLKAFLEKVKSDTYRKNSKQQPPLKPLLKSLKKQDFRLLLKTFNQWDRWHQTQRWKVQLEVAGSAVLTVRMVVGPSTIVNRLRLMVAPLPSGGAISVLPGPEEATKWALVSQAPSPSNTLH